VRAAEAGIPTEVARPAGRTTTRLEAELFEAVVQPHYAPLIRRLVLVLGDRRDAEDVAQETYLKAYRSWDRFDGVDLRGWLYTIALRLAFNELRKRRRWVGVLTRIQPRATWTDATDPDLWDALRSLDPRTRSALLLSAIDGYTQAEIAQILSAPEGTVASWISRGRAMLRRQLGEGEAPS
jgi:RNA polymerase sigma-70 factor (ECF subfamily)